MNSTPEEPKPPISSVAGRRVTVQQLRKLVWGTPDESGKRIDNAKTNVRKLLLRLAKPPGGLNYDEFQKVERGLDGKHTYDALCADVNKYFRNTIDPKLHTWGITSVVPRVVRGTSKDSKSVWLCLFWQPEGRRRALTFHDVEPEEFYWNDEGVHEESNWSNSSSNQIVQDDPSNALSSITLRENRDEVFLRRIVSKWLGLEPVVPPDGPRELNVVGLLITLEKHAEQVPLQHRVVLLDSAMGWAFDLKLSWNVRFRAVALVAKLCLMGAAKDYNWPKWDAISSLVHGNVRQDHHRERILGWGVHWLIAVIVLLGDEDIAQAITLKATQYLDEISPQVREPAALMFCEGLRICLVCAADHARMEERMWEQIGRRIASVLKWTHFEHVKRIEPFERVNQLRVLLAYLSLLHSVKVLDRMRVKNADVSELTSRCTDLLKFLTNRRIRGVAKRFTDLIAREDRVWHVEAACLHEISSWNPGGTMFVCVADFVEFLTVMLFERDDFDSTSWRSWAPIMGVFGAASPVAEIRKLVPQAEVQIPGSIRHNARKS